LTWVPSRAVPSVFAATRHSGKDLKDNPITQQCCDVGMVVWRTNLNDVNANDWKLVGHSANRIEKFARS
jgi:hypothetical protein